MNEELKNDENAIVDATRNVVSRHQGIPPTPRDTMAVIMQAAEQKSARKSAPILARPVFRWASMAAILVVLVLGIGYFDNINNAHESLTSAAEISPLDDLGLDVAAWDMEIESLLDNLDESVAALSYDDYAMMDF